MAEQFNPLIHPDYLSPTAYQQAGGLGDYSKWFNDNLNQFRHTAGYVTMDPSYGFSNNIRTDPFVSAGGNGYNVMTEDQKNAKQQAANESGNAWALSQGYGQPLNTNQNALNVLTKQPSLTNRQPSLAAGQGGWDPTTSTDTAQGSANYTYYSRFA